MDINLDNTILGVRPVHLPSEVPQQNGVLSHEQKLAEGLDRRVIGISAREINGTEHYFIATGGEKCDSRNGANATMQVPRPGGAWDDFEAHYFHLEYRPTDLQTFEKYAHFSNPTPNNPLDLPKKYNRPINRIELAESYAA